MRIDLEHALGSIASTAEASAAPVPVDRLLRRVHRRRTARTVAMTAAGAGAAGAVVLGGAALNRPGPVTPPAVSESPEPTASASATPSPTPDPTVPAAVTLGGPMPACGEPVPPARDPAGDADLHLDLDVPSSLEVPGDAFVGDPLVASVTLVNGTDGQVDALLAAPLLLAVQDGVVVAVSSAGEAGTEASLAPGGNGGVDVRLDLVGCAPTDVGAALAPGDYDLYAVQEMSVALASDDGVVPPARTPLTVVGGPARFTLTAAEVDATPSAETPPPVEDLVITTSGLGPLTVGLPPETNPGRAMIEFDDDFCGADYDGDPGRWVSAGYALLGDTNYFGESTPYFRVDADETAVRWIDVQGTTIRTAEGLGVGSTLAELRAAYPRLAGPFDGPVSRVWWITGQAGTLVFETQGDADGLRPAGTEDGVILMRVLAPGIDPAFATANSDQVAGGCL